ncbi:MAG: sigma-54-dependent Fis family transcriptional regulator [Verrucomicrobia bacterium]|nr:sigma-54-dependent Fis family transcriptional regulator [Verrucomicrobiota bacterium]MBI3871112.1 sigma-54-dependent Fis family transcriptional regulator [Verrucomicrobiota bacterium]
MQSPDLKGLSVLIVEDEPLLRRQLSLEVEQLAADVTSVGTLEALGRATEGIDFDFILLDLHLPDGNAMTWLKDGRHPRNAAIIVMTAHGEVSGAVEAMRLGAIDYLVKPLDPAQVSLALVKARQLKHNARLEEHRRNDGALSSQHFFFGQTLEAVSRQLEKIVTADRRMAQLLPPVLIQGETGTGKTTIARWLHHQGPRSQAQLVEVNCSALPDTLAESELFGHERGAFTDARNARMGLFEAADGGTLFLDELPSLSPMLQAKVLKVIEDHRIRRLGGNREIPVDVRIIAAAPQDLARLVSTGQFRQDLFHRLDLYRIALPPLRERKEDLMDLAQLLLQQICRRHRIPLRPLSDLGRRRLLSHSWPGNVRELSHELERGVVFEEGGQLNLDHMGPAAMNEPSTATGRPPAEPGLKGLESWFNEDYVFPKEGFSLESAIGQLIHHALAQTHENVSAAARLLGVSRDYLRYRLADSKDEPPRDTDAPA